MINNFFRHPERSRGIFQFQKIPPLIHYRGIGRNDMRAGFTLIEILVAATIIGLLSTIGMTGFQAVTRNGRDAVRKSDLEQIRSALEIYKSEKSEYPVDSDCRAPLLTTDYINPFPSDPRISNYRYCYVQIPSLVYNLCAHLENGKSDVDYATQCGGNNNCGPALDATTNCNYKVTNP